MNGSEIIEHEALVPAGYVVLHRRIDGRVWAVEPDPKTGLLWFDARFDQPPGWRVVGEDWMGGPFGAVLLAPGPTWRAWWLYFGARRVILRTVYPIACVALVGLARLARVKAPFGLTFRGALEAMGAAVEAERRRSAGGGDGR